MITTQPAAPIDRMEHTAPVGIRWHEYCTLFPEMEPSAFAELKADIKKNGVLEPIVFLHDAILDGRNRYLAARELGIEYPRVEFTGEDALAFVLAKNLSRRHLTDRQRADVAARLAKLERGRPSEENPPIGGITVAEAAKMMDVPVKAVERSKVIQEKGAPELQAAYQAGEVSQSAAAEVAKLPADEQVKVVAEGKAKAVAKEQRETKAAAKPTAEKPRAPSQAEYEALQAELEEVRDERDALRADIARLTADLAKLEDMKIEFARGGFDEVVKTLKETIEVQKTRIERESQEKVRNLNTSEMWRRRAVEAGWSNDIEIEIPGRAAHA